MKHGHPGEFPHGIEPLWGWAVALALLAVAAAFRVPGVMGHIFDQDELYTLVESTHLFSTTLEPGIEARPVYYLLQHALLGVVPHTEIGLRILPMDIRAGRSSSDLVDYHSPGRTHGGAHRGHPGGCGTVACVRVVHRPILLTGVSPGGGILLLFSPCGTGQQRVEMACERRDLPHPGRLHPPHLRLPRLCRVGTGGGGRMGITST